MFFITPTLETERLVLKKGTADDFVKVYEYNFTKLRDICGEFEFVKCNPAHVATFATYSEEEENVYDWILYRKDSMEPIGNLVADRFNPDLNSMELAFNLHPTHWGNEYMKEAIIEVCRFLFEQGYDNVIAGYDEGNKKSKRVQEKVGFEPFRVIENAWQKNGVPITTYELILTKARFAELYGIKE